MEVVPPQPQFDVVAVEAVLPPGPPAPAGCDAPAKTTRLRANTLRRPPIGIQPHTLGPTVSPKSFDVVKATRSAQIRPQKPSRPLAPASNPG